MICGAFIEARSCERFAALGAAIGGAARAAVRGAACGGGAALHGCISTWRAARRRAPAPSSTRASRSSQQREAELITGPRRGVPLPLRVPAAFGRMARTEACACPIDLRGHADYSAGSRGAASTSSGPPRSQRSTLPARVPIAEHDARARRARRRRADGWPGGGYARAAAWRRRGAQHRRDAVRIDVGDGVFQDCRCAPGCRRAPRRPARAARRRTARGIRRCHSGSRTVARRRW